MAEKKGRLTLYEDLLSKETIAEMQAKDAAKQAESAKKKKDASLLAFKPTSLGKKPGTQPKAKPKPNFSAMHKYSSSESASTISAPAAPSSLPPSDAPSEALPQDPSSTPQQPGAQPKMTQKRGFNDWLANDDEEDYYIDRPRHERGGRKKKKKKQQQHQEQTWSWDDIYDPTVPTPFLEYARSDARYDLNEDWKRRLYDAHKREMRRQGRDNRRASSEDDSYRPRMGMGMQFAPPGAMSFAPPSNLDSPSDSRPVSSGPYNGDSSPNRARSVQGRDNSHEPERPSFHAALPPTVADINMEESADEVYARRMAMSGNGTSMAQTVPPPPPPPQGMPPIAATAAPPTIATPALSAADAEKKAKVAAQIAAMKAKLGKPASPQVVQPVQATGVPIAQPPVPESASNYVPPSVHVQQQALAAVPPPPPPPPPPLAEPAAAGMISAAPTFNPEYYAQKQQAEAELAQPAVPADAPEEKRTSRPGQTGFAERMMKKLGWEKGQGLGASGEGITTALQMKADKRKKKSDAQGGGFVTPANMGKIVGGKKAKAKPSEDQTEGEQQPKTELDGMSEVVKLEGMLENMDVDHEIAENNLMQEIGDEMGTGYGKVERLFIWRKAQGGNDDVFVKFTSPLSAVRCLKGMDGVEFADNEVKARFWDAEKFERGEYA